MLHPKYVLPAKGLTLQRKLQETIATVFYDGRIVPRHTDYQHFYEDTKDGYIYPSVTTKTGVLDKKYLKQWAVNQGVKQLEDYINGRDSYDREGLLEAVHKSKTAHKDTFETSGIWGSHGHDLVDMYVTLWINRGVKPTEDILSFAEPDISPEGKCAALGAMQFFSQHTLFPIVSECKILSKKYAYAGTLDSLWLVGEVYKGREGKGDCEHEWLERKPDHIRCSLCAREEKLRVTLIDLKTSNAIFGYGDMAKYDYAAQVSAYAESLREMTGIKCYQQWIVRLDKLRPRYEVGIVANPKDSFALFLNLSAAHNHMRNLQEPLKPLKPKNVIIVP
jgi:hypothetical protein